jgi:4-amino-4-deoxy-L-arabinose transferase-like glycosyltransferase
MGWATALWLALVCSLALFLGLFTLAPVDKTEALQIGIAETMLRLHAWVVPQWNGHLYADKPPLPYWLDEVLWQWFGLTPELARLPAAICASLGVAVIACLVQRVARRELPAREAWLRSALAGTVLALSPGWIGFAHAAVHDIYLAVAITLAVAGHAIGFCLPECQSHSRPRLWAAWIGFWCGVGFLSKGLLGIGLPLLIIGADCALQRQTRRTILRPLPLLQMGTVMLLVISPWLAGLIAGGHWNYLQGFLGFSNLQRATRVVDGHDQPLLFYLPVLLALLGPWWPLLLSALGHQWQRRRRWRQAEGLERLAHLAALWLLLGLGLFTLIPTKLPGYVLPLLPAAVLLMAAAPRRPAWSLRLVALQLILALPAALIAARLGGC